MTKKYIKVSKLYESNNMLQKYFKTEKRGNIYSKEPTNKLLFVCVVQLM